MNTSEFIARFSSMEQRLKNFALQLTNDPNNADDLFQETAYRAFKYQGMFQSDTNMKAWLMTIMRNVFINEYRRKKKNKTLSNWTETDRLENTHHHTTGNHGEINIAVEDIEKVISKLDENLFIPFKMRSDGFKYQEIADQLALPLGTVKSRIFMARKELQFNLNKVA